MQRSSSSGLPSFDRRAAILAACVLVLTTIVVFAPVRGFEFVQYDDNAYVTTNRHVQQGLTWDTVQWAFTTYDVMNWHPLTWLSLAADAQFFGLNPGWFHVTNLVIHTASGLALLWALLRMTGCLGSSFMVAMLFALHPLHVESVAWVAERKDVLSGLFWNLTLYAYVRYVECRTVFRLAMVIVACALGLMSKPIVVTLPCVLLLLDYWPLERPLAGRKWARLIVEKLPLFALVAVSCLVTFRAQQLGGAVATVEHISLSERIANAIVGAVVYLGQMVWPVPLSVHYPFVRRSLSDLPVVASVVLLTALSAVALWQSRRRPYLIVGWLWYLGTLAPVIGLVQVGSQAHADRYTYLSLIGVFIAVVWFARERLDAAIADPGRRRVFGAGLGAAAIILCAWTSFRQLPVWRDSETLLNHSLMAVGSTAAIHDALSQHYQNQQRFELAIEHLRKVVELYPDRPQTWSRLGWCLLRVHRAGEAGAVFQRLINIPSTSSDEFVQRGDAMLKKGAPATAAAFYATAIELDSQNAVAYLRLAAALEAQASPQAARDYLEDARRIQPDLQTHAEWIRLDAILRQQLSRGGSVSTGG